ncbi:CRISPR system precrRNA processing endoribonuclease RAMP protein Cas6 [Methanonatronarchaeum sp. AMET-Sl]|uniref:CRISPR system precrRNA processing endoribonuclease RAMP protein Cas6 n=1 Tax=Methanonatronarchaeum sp. AMET-Sl TaxID=3037654 RepID=UPI00244E32A6|nr:CRISPR system precrRNA processing endoribonuclease RAMP protein Cas6 [Methanonatronarchaeum sp. AMET-Sl]WGI17874.1 CRISPR system precrRNA processing endoribonuclease RAMP protein Cas6 [Methanonatronarchaeum sp. AMET-Sl]
MKKIEISCSPLDKLEVPNSDGYLLYSTLLSKISEKSSEVSTRIHDSNFSSISVSSLNGIFHQSSRRYHKVLKPSEDYTFKVGVTDPKEEEIFKALIEPLIFGDGLIEFDNGSLEVKEISSNETSFEDLFTKAVGFEKPEFSFEFTSPTCIKFKNSSITEMFPQRVSVFNSIKCKWNKVAPDKYALGLSREDIGSNLIEKPQPKSYRTHSVVVNRVFDENKKHKRPIIRQGFTGKCTYSIFKEASKDIKNALTLLAMFSEYSGVGSAVSRGCGSVITEIQEVN